MFAPLLQARRWALPSMATISPPKTDRRDWVHCMKHSMNDSGLRERKTRLNVSCDGMPLGSFRKERSQSSRAWPKVSMSVNPTAPQIKLNTPMARMSINWWSRVRWIRGSSTPCRHPSRLLGFSCSSDGCMRSPFSG